ncbi:unnamed protein product [Plutella xylostella]|uniref:Multiple inositol polyphosphate phosphatase 1 n=1 Tax=Plutella xylostella TaxID=51655 RepID=A0A8S4EID2_PLUXY|nr:unnamed protein product [Plutella xylostella]
MYWSILSIYLLVLFCQTITTRETSDILDHLSTRTPYRFIYNRDDAKIKYPNCKAAKIWMVTRHGTRLPSPKDIRGLRTTLKDLRDDIVTRHRLGKGDLTEEQIQRFEDWSSDILPSDAKILTAEGKDEMMLLAERIRKRFPNIIKNKFDNKTFHFRYTATQRAEESAKSFAVGLFKEHGAKAVKYAPIPKHDPVLRFYKYCDKWLKQVKNDTNTYKEVKNYITSEEMNTTLDSVSKRLGLDYMLSFDAVNLMYSICGFETSWHKDLISPWCFAFDQADIQKLEYYHDLKHYWVDGYGRELTYRQACLSIKTMFKIFSDTKSPNATFLFAHSGTLLKLLSHMQLYKPREHLRGDRMDLGRPWRMSKIDSFGANLAFVLFRCKDGDKVLTLHQERPVQLPMCDSELCPLQTLLEHFHESIHHCDYNDLCSLHTKTEL